MAFQPTEHPVLALPSKERMLEFKKRGKKGLDELIELLEKREELIRLERSDPFRYGYEPPNWKDTDELWEKSSELLIQGGNRAGKSEYAAKKVIRMLGNKKNAKVIDDFFAEMRFGPNTSGIICKSLSRALSMKFLKPMFATY